MGAWEDVVTISILCFEAKLALNQSSLTRDEESS